MKGYLWTPGATHGSRAAPPSGAAGEGTSRLAPWEAIAVDAVGNVIEFWGFKRNQGRIWALLYLRGEPMTAAELERELDLSKGGMSMLLRDVERWGVVQRVRTPGDQAWRYAAETDLIRMVSRVVEEREAAFLARIRADLAEALRLAAQAPGVPAEQLGRLQKMALLAEQTERAIRLFLRTTRFEVGGIFAVLRGEGGEGRPPRGRGGHRGQG